MIEFPFIAGLPDDAPRGARQPEGKPGEFASTLDAAIRAGGDNTDARREPPEATRSADIPDEHAAAQTQTAREFASHPMDEPVADRHEPDVEPASNPTDATAAETMHTETETETDSDLLAPDASPITAMGAGVATGGTIPADNAVMPAVLPAGDAAATSPDISAPTAGTSQHGHGAMTGTATTTPATVPLGAPVDGATGTGATTTPQDATAATPTTETAPPTATPDPAAPPAIAAAPTTGDSVAPASPGTAGSPEHTPDGAARVAAPTGAPVADAVPAYKPAATGHAAGPAAATGGNAPAAPTPDTGAQTAQTNTAPGSAFAQMIGNVEADGAAGQGNPVGANTGATTTASATATGGQANGAAQTGADTSTAQTTQTAQTAAAAAGHPLPMRDPAAIDTRTAATGTPQLQPVIAAGAAASDIRVAADVSPAAKTAAGQLPLSAAVQQVSLQIGRSVQNGLDRFTLELKPADLGHVSVKMEIGFDHRVIAVISADRADTLDLLQRDARLLERTLQDAGLKTDQGSLSFNLRGDGAGGYDTGDYAPAGQLAAIDLDDDIAAVLDDAPTATIAPTDGSGINIQV